MILAAALLAGAGGCSVPDAGGGGDFTPDLAPATARQQVRERAERVAAIAAISLDAPKEERLTCPGQISDFPDKELYRMQGTYHLPIAAAEEKATYALLTDHWQAAGLHPRTGDDPWVKGPWAGPADLKIDLRDGHTVALSRSTDTTVRMIVWTRCLHETD
ncbi:hypothetical protein Val02_08410 [Virgisporangium aliadipatigenens]|uniref:Lipoprotein n=2 Tax=Virgisporangium aliadipatigenens TaxID=741659 RepID=A0A8J3YH65_9ACTN|nr:hypothetical protein Val02_08410 [Virgisporangium aliadipatigenens]